MLAIAISVLLGVALLAWARVRTDGDLNLGFLAAVTACVAFWAIGIAIAIFSL